jgi:hypothetical protein
MPPEAIRTTELGGAFEIVRFVFNGYSSYQMQQIGSGLLTRAMIPRIRSGQTIYDSPAPPLSPAYAKAKRTKGRQPIRNWELTGRLLRSVKVISSQINLATLGFTDSVANSRAYYNNRRARQFGVSLHDRPILSEEFAKQPPHTTAQVVR